MNLEDHLDERIHTPIYNILKANLVTFIRDVLGTYVTMDLET